MITSLLLSLVLQAAEPPVEDANPAQDPAENSAQSAEPKAADTFDADAALTGINAYLNSIETLRARFVQVSPTGAFVEGLLSISRPGRLRFEYDDPSPIRVIAGGTTIGIEDRELETVDRGPLRATPLWWILKQDINLARDAEVIEITEEFGFIYLTLQDPTGEMEGRLQLVFAGPDYELREWFAIDALGQITRVSLVDMETGVRLSPRLFVIPDPENSSDSRRSRR